MFQRPRKDEDEEDLLELQRQFLSEKQKSAAQATRQQDKKAEEDESIADNHDVPINIEINVIERDTSNCKARPPSQANANKCAFPRTFKLKREALVSGSKSLFAQSFAPKGERNISPPESHVFGESKLSTGLSLGEREMSAIHSENLQMLSSWTPEERLEARKQILSNLSPKAIQFIKSQQVKRPIKPEVAEPMEIAVSSEDCIKKGGEEREEEALPITRELVTKHKWLNMNKIEKEKLEWLKPVVNVKRQTEENADVLNQLGIRDARFDLQGNIVTDDKQGSFSGKEGLHHHGEEPERGGYTLTELLTLLESTFASQKVISLNLLGKIMEQSNRGVFDHLLEMSCLSEQLLEGTAVLLMVRKLLDDTSASVSTSALACLKQIMCNLELDELYLDRIFAWFFWCETSYPGPLDPDFKADKDKPLQEMADDGYIRKDPIPALIRTDVLVRLAYMLENQVKCQDDPIAVKNLFSILIRVARHSSKSCERIIETPYLLKHIINYFLQPSFVSMDTFYGNPYSKALKLLRILCQEKDACEKVYKCFGDEIITSCLAYLALDPLSIESKPSSKKKSSDFMQLIQEALKFLVVITDHQLALDTLQTVSPLLVPQAQYFFTLDIACINSPEKQFDWQFASSLLLLLRNICRARSELAPIYSDIVKRVTFQWIKRLLEMNILPASVDASNALMAGVVFVVSTPSFEPASLSTFTREDSLSQVCKIVDKMCSSLSSHSSMINGQADKEALLRRSCSIHPDYRSLLESSREIHPSLADDCVIPLMQSVILIVQATKNSQLTRRLLLSESMQQLTLKMTRCTKSIDSYFSMLQVQLIKQLVLLVPQVLSGDVDGEACRLYLLLAIRLVPMLPTPEEKKTFLQSVIFNSSLYCDQLPRMLQSSLSLHQTGNKFSVSEVLENALLIYSNLSPLCSEFWLFDPILYVSKVVQSVSSEETDFQEAIEAVLAFIQLLFDSAAGYFDFTQSQCNKFTSVSLLLLMSIYLTGSKYFLNERVKSYMRTALQVYLVDERTVDRHYLLKASSQVPGHLIYGKERSTSPATITKYFERLLQEYAAESYSDPLFTSFILLFLRSDNQVTGSDSLRSVFFSEANTELLESMYTRIEDYEENLLIQLLHPPERDISIIELFTKCLLSRTIVHPRNPVVYWMLVYHVHQFMFKSETCAADEKKKAALFSSISALRDDTLKSHLTSFKMEYVYSLCRRKE